MTRPFILVKDFGKTLETYYTSSNIEIQALIDNIFKNDIRYRFCIVVDVNNGLLSEINVKMTVGNSVKLYIIPISEFCKNENVNCVHCGKKENNDINSTEGWFSANYDGDKVCDNCL